MKIKLIISIIFCFLARPATWSADVGEIVEKLQEVLSKRLKPYKPQAKDFIVSVRPSLENNESLDNYNSVECMFVIDSPKNLSQRILVTVDIREYADAAQADKKFWELRETASIPGPLFQNTRGFDVLAINGNSIKGLLGRNTLEMSCVGKKNVPDPFAGSNIKPNPDAGWYAGMADFMLDIWKEAQGAPYSNVGIALVDPGPMRKNLYKEAPIEKTETFKLQTNLLDELSPPNKATSYITTEPHSSISSTHNWLWSLAGLLIAASLLAWMLRRGKKGEGLK